MKHAARICSAFLFLTLVFTACNKDEDPVVESSPVPTPSVSNPLLALFQSHVTDATQRFAVQASSGGFIQGTKGVQVFIAPNAFKDQNGQVVTGEVTVELVEAVDVSDMLWLNKQTVGMDNGVPKPLVSGGQFYLNATQAGQQLALVPGSTNISVPANNPDPSMELFSGTVDADGVILWTPFGQNGADLDTDSLAYTFPNDSLGWINCDYFNSWGVPLTRITVDVPAEHNGANTLVWVVFPSINSLTGVGFAAGDGVFQTSSGYAAPTGMDVVIVGFALIDNVYYSSFTNTTLVPDHTEQITFQATTEAQFMLDVQGL
jgi:hypothetical protein